MAAILQRIGRFGTKFSLNNNYPNAHNDHNNNCLYNYYYYYIVMVKHF